MHVSNTSTLSLEKTALLDKLHELEESNLEKVDKLVKLEEKYEILQETLKITEQRLVEKEIECASLTEKIRIVNTQTESNDHPKTSMSTKEREINLASAKLRSQSLVEEMLTKQVIVMRIKPLPKRKNDLLRQIDFLNSIILDTKLKEPNKNIRYVVGTENKVADALSRVEIDVIIKPPILDYKMFAQTQPHDSEIQSLSLKQILLLN
ncbi:hypothetical protein TNCV_2038851 [Trichonephila clavipes]|nr:hypothetical protein TNCV_2038851 [Trichonephila clavipes]